MAPNAESFQAAAANADWAGADWYYLILTDQAGAKSWPITGASFILVYKQPTDAAAVLEALKFFAWAYKDGATMAAELDYVPLPAPLIAQVQKDLDDCKSPRAVIRFGAANKRRFADWLAKIRMVKIRWRLGVAICQRSTDLGVAGAKLTSWRSSDPRHAAKQLIYERIFRSATLTAAILVLLILGGVAVSLLRGAWPALAHFGFSFVTREIWNPVTDQFGALAPIYGTVVTSLIAMADCGADGIRHRLVPDRTVSAAC